MIGSCLIGVFTREFVLQGGMLKTRIGRVVFILMFGGLLMKCLVGARKILELKKRSDLLWV